MLDRPVFSLLLSNLGPSLRVVWRVELVCVVQRRK